MLAKHTVLYPLQLMYEANPKKKTKSIYKVPASLH